MRLAILAFAAGVLALQCQPALPPYAAWGLLAVLPLPWLCLPRHWTVRLLLLLLCAGFGWSYAAWRAELRLAEALAAEWEGRDVEVLGVIAGLPQAFQRGSRFEFVVETVLTAEAVVPRRLMLSWYAGRQAGEAESGLAQAGERWQFTVRLRRPHGNANPGAFDYSIEV